MVITQSEIVFLDIQESQIFESVSEIFPNPSGDKAFIVVNVKIPAIINFMMTDLAGRILFSNSINIDESSRIELDLNKLSKGIYYLTLQDQDGAKIVKPVIKN